MESPGQMDGRGFFLSAYFGATPVSWGGGLITGMLFGPGSGGV